MNAAKRVIMKLGGDRAVARLLGVHPTTVIRWRISKERGGTGGLIPSWHQATLLRLAAERGIELSPADFFDMPDREVRHAS